MFDVAIVGGSIAGLSAALLLGRCRRNVAVCDNGRARNRFSHHMHGFLSREGIPPAEFLEVSRKQIAEFPNVRFHAGTVMGIQRGSDEFSLTLQEGAILRARTVLLATGIVDELPDLPGLEELYGRSVHHCPYCDGWEHQDEPIAVYGKGEAGIEMAEEMRIWSRDLIYFSDGENLSEPALGRLGKLGVKVVRTKISALSGENGKLDTILLSDGEGVARKAMFFVSTQRQNCDLADKLGCSFQGGFVTADDDLKTCVPGLYVAGNTSTGLQLAIVAAAEGTKAAHAINLELLARDTTA
jgi:thioredoxin reductase